MPGHLDSIRRGKGKGNDQHGCTMASLGHGSVVGTLAVDRDPPAHMRAGVQDRLLAFAHVDVVRAGLAHPNKFVV